MNVLKAITASLVAAAALTGVASAQTTVYIAGSTAYRAPVSAAIINALGGTSCQAAYAGSSLLGGTNAIFEGTNGGTSYIVEVNWTGSAAGVVDLATQNTTLVYPNPSDSTVTGALATCTASPFGGGGKLPSGYATIPHAPTVAMSDSFATSVAAAVSTASLTAQPGANTVSPLTGPGLQTFITNAPLSEAGTNAPIVTGQSGYLGIIPFQWVLGNDTGTGVLPFTNMTQQSAAYLITHTGAPVTLFSPTQFTTAGAATTTANSPADFAFLIGRNEDSGTRIAAFSEAQQTFTVNPKQYLLAFSGTSTTSSANPAPKYGVSTGGSAATVENAQLWPSDAGLNTESSINWANQGTGHSGYVNGGDVANAISAAVDENNISFGPGGNGVGDPTENAATAGAVYFVGYIGVADTGAGYVTPGSSPSKVAHGTTLTYNGVQYSPANVVSGLYSFWSYEHMYYLTSGTGAIGAAKNFVDGLANSIAGTYAVYDSGGNSAPTTDGAGVFLPGAGGSSKTGTVTRGVEGGPYTLNY